MPTRVRALSRGLERTLTSVDRALNSLIYKAIAWRPQDQPDAERLLTLYATEINVARVLAVVGEFAEAMEEPERVSSLKRVIDAIVG